jgi:hypothetical protein
MDRVYTLYDVPQCGQNSRDEKRRDSGLSAFDLTTLVRCRISSPMPNMPRLNISVGERL